MEVLDMVGIVQTEIGHLMYRVMKELIALKKVVPMTFYLR